MSVSIRLTLGAFLICTGMSGNGVLIGSEPTNPMSLSTWWVQLRVCLGYRRGGSWNGNGTILSSARRADGSSSLRYNDLGFRLAFRQITTPPRDLNSTAPLTIAENQPIGTIVGEFNATDPDTNSTITYHLVNGVGDGNNFLFTLGYKWHTKDRHHFRLRNQRLDLFHPCTGQG